MVTLAKRSGGNPLFLRELVSAARSAGSVAALPDTVEGLMTSQIDRLHPADRTLLRTASVLGTSFSPAFLEEILGEEGAALEVMAWERAEAKYALADAGDLYRRALEAARHLPAVSPIELAAAHEALGDVRDRVGLYEEAARAYRNARRLVAGDPLAEAKLLLKESR